MKLFHVWNVMQQNGAPSVWQRFASLKKPPKVAYRLRKDAVKLATEFKVIDEHRNECILTAAGKGPGEDVNLASGTPEFAVFVEKFNEFLNGDSDLDPVGINMDALIDALDAEKGNVLSELDIELLEPFFADKPKPDLKVVESA